MLQEIETGLNAALKLMGVFVQNFLALLGKV